MAQNLLDEKELEDAIRYEIISPSFAERVSQLIKAYEQNAAQQSVQATGLTCPSCGSESTKKYILCMACGVHSPCA